MQLKNNTVHLPDNRSDVFNDTTRLIVSNIVLDSVLGRTPFGQTWRLETANRFLAMSVFHLIVRPLLKLDQYSPIVYDLAMTLVLVIIGALLDGKQPSLESLAIYISIISVYHILFRQGILNILDHYGVSEYTKGAIEDVIVSGLITISNDLYTGNLVNNPEYIYKTITTLLGYAIYQEGVKRLF